MSNTIDGSASRPDAQSGAVLFVSMMLLLVMTLIGLATMGTARLEEKMSANSMNSNVSLHASESAVDAALLDVNNLVTALNSGATVTITPNFGVSSMTAKAEITYKNSTRAAGFSFGNNQGTFSTYQFEALGTGEVPAANAKTVTGHGVYRVGPGI